MSNNLERFVFFDSESTSSESSVLSNSNKGEEMTVQVSGIGSNTVNILFKGMADYKSEEFVELAAISLSDFKIKSTITEDGIYSIPVNGIGQIKAVCSGGVGTVKVYGMLIEG